MVKFSLFGQGPMVDVTNKKKQKKTNKQLKNVQFTRIEYLGTAEKVFLRHFEEHISTMLPVCGERRQAVVEVKG